MNLPRFKALRPARRRALGEAALACLISLVAAAAITWPAVLHMDEVIVGGGELGGWLWRYWWHSMELEALGSAKLGPIDTWNVFLSLGRYPETGNILDVLLLSFPLQKLFALPTHYNVKIFLILMVNGLCAYALARSFVAHRLSCLAACVIAVVNPVVVQDLYGSGLRQCLLWWVLLFPALLFRADRRGDWRSGALAGVVFGLASAFYWFYGLFLAVFIALWGLWKLAVEGRDLDLRVLARWFIPLVVVGGGLSLLFFMPYLNAAGGGSTAGGSALPELSFFLPFPDYDVIKNAPLRPSTYAENVLSSLNRTVLSSWSPDYLWNPGHPRPLPLVVLVLGVIPALFLFRSLKKVRFWVLVFAFFYLGSLGPYMKSFGASDTTEVMMLGGDWVVRLPYTWMFRWIPGMSRMFAPYRLGALLVVGSVVLLAYGLAFLSRGRSLKAQRILALLCVVLCLGMSNYRWEVGPVPDDAIAPDKWRAPLKVSGIRVPDFYKNLDREVLGGIVELPLGQQQDLICFYQTVHQQKVYRSWATPPAVPPVFQKEGGGRSGERLRFLARQDRFGSQAGDLLQRLSDAPQEVDLQEVGDSQFAHMLMGGNYQYIVIHERGYYLQDPFQGGQLYADVVRRMEKRLGLEATQVVEHTWFDYPGNEYKVPDGPVYLPWTSQQVNLPDRERPSRYFMAIFEVDAFLEAYEGPGLPPISGAASSDHQNVGPNGEAPEHKEHIHQEVLPEKQIPGDEAPQDAPSP
jgi:hypothetical protein